MKPTRPNPYTQNRVGLDFVKDEIAHFEGLYPDLRLLIVTDRPNFAENLPDKTVLTLPQQRDALVGEDLADTLCLLAIDNDEIGARAVADILAKGAKFVPVRRFGKASYFHLNKVWRDAARREFLHQRAQGFAKWDVLDFDNLVQALDRTASIPGDYIEIGCFRGSSGSAVLSYLSAMKRSMTCWFLDVFEGFNYETAKTSGDAVWLGSHKTEGLETVTARLKRFESERLHVNVLRSDIIADDLPPALRSIAVANIDVDIYEGVFAGLEKCAPLIAKGGVMFAEDCGHTPGLIGAKLACDEFMKTEAARDFFPFYLHSGQLAFFRIH